ncbi:unnamed protein product [Paramecium octaurelia]|uniref:Uncharacterized protein n=1 Tax=Paramecium octaurelia TaxID=43137 RepID=A0A8S1VHF2_PAROT|nr:unnamed protein product [Paramecium octaurelia]
MITFCRVEYHEEFIIKKNNTSIRQNLETGLMQFKMNGGIQQYNKIGGYAKQEESIIKQIGCRRLESINEKKKTKILRIMGLKLLISKFKNKKCLGKKILLTSRKMQELKMNSKSKFKVLQ